MSTGKSTILILQDVLFKNTNPNIITTISEDQTTITASNISEFDFSNLSVITNNPGYNSTYFYLTDIKVYLENNLFPTIIYGLYDIVLARISSSDAQAFVDDKKSHQPFINGFQNGTTIGELIDTLSNLSRATPDTYGIPKKFVLTFDPPPFASVKGIRVLPSGSSSNSTSAGVK